MSGNKPKPKRILPKFMQKSKSTASKPASPRSNSKKGVTRAKVAPAGTVTMARAMSPRSKSHSVTRAKVASPGKVTMARAVSPRPKTKKEKSKRSCSLAKLKKNGERKVNEWNVFFGQHFANHHNKLVKQGKSAKVARVETMKKLSQEYDRVKKEKGRK